MYNLKVIKWYSIAALTCLGSFLFVGCGSDPLNELSPEQPEVPIDPETPKPPTPGVPQVTLSFDSEKDVPQGRASIDEDSIADNKGTVLRWDAGDEVTMWMGSDKKACTFVTEHGGLRTASFTYTGDSVDTKTYFGFYPKQDSGSTILTLSIPTDGSIRQERLTDSKHLAPYRAMYAKTVSRAESSNVLTGVVFKPLTSLIVLEISNMTGKEVAYNSFSLSVKDGSSQIFYGKAAYEAGSDQTEVKVVDESKSAVSILSLGKNGEGMKIASSHKSAVFMPLFPSASLNGIPLQMKLATTEGEIVKDFPSQTLTSWGNFKTGMFYLLKVKHTLEGLVIDSTVIGEWEDGGTIVIPID